MGADTGDEPHAERVREGVLIALRVAALLLAAGSAFLVLPLVFVVAPGPGEPVVPHVPWLAGVVGLVVVTGLLTSVVGYRAPPLPAGLPPHEAGRRSGAAFGRLGVLRLALAVVPVPVGLALAFLSYRGELVLYLVAATGSTVLLAVHGWPGRRAVDRVQRSLERAGTPSLLPEALGLARRA